MGAPAREGRRDLGAVVDVERQAGLRPRAELCALLPGVQARQAFDTLNALAQAAASGDARTVDQRRADALMDLLCGRADPPQVQVQVVVPVETLTGDADTPGWVLGLGPITAGEARDLARSASASSVSALIADPETGSLTSANERLLDQPAEPQYRPSRGLDRAVRQRDLNCRFPGCRRSAMGTASDTELDHTTPRPMGPTAWDNLAVLCRRHHRLKHSPGWRVELAEEGVMTWTTPTGRRYETQRWQYIERRDTS